MWIHLTLEEYEREVTADEKMEVEKPFFFELDEEGKFLGERARSEVTHVEVHCDEFQETEWRDSATTSVLWDRATQCARGHDKSMCRCGTRVVRCRQDESIFKANAVRAAATRSTICSLVFNTYVGVSLPTVPASSPSTPWVSRARRHRAIRSIYGARACCATLGF